MTSSYFWINTIGLAIGTFAIRFAIIALSERVHITDRTKELFTFIPAAILPAFIAPAVFFHRGAVEWVQGKERFVIVLLACGVGVVTRSTLAVISFGLLALYLMTQLG